MCVRATRLSKAPADTGVCVCVCQSQADTGVCVCVCVGLSLMLLSSFYGDVGIAE